MCGLVIIQLFILLLKGVNFLLLFPSMNFTRKMPIMSEMKDNSFYFRYRFKVPRPLHLFSHTLIMKPFYSNIHKNPALYRVLTIFSTFLMALVEQQKKDDV